MDTLEHTDSSARLRRAMFLSIMVYMVWVMFFAPQQQIQQVATIDGNEATQNDSIVETTPEPVVENTPPINPVQNTIPDHFESFSDDQVRATISSKNGSINSAELLDFPELPVNNPWWSWIIGGEGEWDPYIKGADAYPISTVNGSLILAGSGRPVVNENYSITRTKSEVVAISASGGMTIQKNYKKNRQTVHL